MKHEEWIQALANVEQEILSCGDVNHEERQAATFLGNAVTRLEEAVRKRRLQEEKTQPKLI